MNHIATYKPAIRFSLVLAVCVALSLFCSRFIPGVVYGKIVAPVLFAFSFSVCLCGAWLIFRHYDKIRSRLVWGWILLICSFAGAAYLLLWALSPSHTVINIGTGNTVNLRPVIVLYPFALVAFMVFYIREYRLVPSEVQWAVRYFAMTLLLVLSYFFMNFAPPSSARGFTLLWLAVFIFVYATEHILFGSAPVTAPRPRDSRQAEDSVPQLLSANRLALEEWMERKKPYTNPKFKLSDLQAVLPMNRTYLSQFIHSEYGCTFYQYVNRYRIEEAMRLKLSNPAMKFAEIATLCGFSSPSVFTRTFTLHTGLSPIAWSKKIDSA